MNKKRFKKEDIGTGAKKSLGQHWLTSLGVVERMIEQAAVQKNAVVLEVGPGKGVLTDGLLKKGAQVLAVEKDHRMIPLLEERFSNAIRTGQLTVLEQDVLDVEIPREPYIVVANIPYYLTGAILKRFLTALHQPKSMTLLVQKEVALRIARDRKESILSLSVKAYGDPIYVQTVKAGSFSPPPKVDSAILHIQNISRKKFVSTTHEKQFFELVKTGFSSKRKKLAGNLKSKIKNPREALVASGVSVHTRAEDVPLEKWLLLSSATL